MILSTCVLFVIGSLPLLRSYEFFGRFDALNHLGLLNEMLAGGSANTTIYPGSHLLATTIVRITGLSPRVALLLLVPVFLLLFSLGIYSIATHWGVSTLGRGIAGVVPLTLPFVISVRLPKLQPLPTVAALLMFPLLLYLFFHGLHSRRRFTACLLIVAIAHVIYHPQHSLVFVLGILLGNVIVFLSSGNERTLKPRFTLPAFVGAVLMAWLYTKPVFWGAFMNVVESVQSDTGVVEGATPSGESLATVGGSLVEVGAKVFAPKVFLLVALLTLCIYLYVRLDTGRSPSNRELYTLAFVGAVGVFVPLFAVGFARSQMFRYIGAGMIFLSILFILYSSERDVPQYQPGMRGMVALLLLLSTVAALPIAYKSPYVYQPGEHVTAGEFDGYEFTFENRHERPLRSLGSGVDRYRNALYGGSPPPQARATDAENVPPVGLQVLNRSVGDARGTFVLTEYTKVQSLQLYPEIGYTEEDFAYLETGPGIHKLYSNGGTNVYSSRRSRAISG